MKTIKEIHKTGAPFPSVSIDPTKMWAFIKRFKLDELDESVEEFMTERIGHLQEELNEMRHAVEAGDLGEVWDAIGDLLYIAIQTAIITKMPMGVVMGDIHKANMTKVLKDTAKRVEKPDDFVSPDFTHLASNMEFFDVQD